MNVGKKPAEGLAKGDSVLVSLFDAGLLAVRTVKGVIPLDSGKWIEVETDDGLKRLVGQGESVVVLGGVACSRRR